MLFPHLVRTLTVDPAQHPRGQAYLSAASGLVQVNNRFYVVADDEHHVGHWPCTGAGLVQLQRVLAGDLPHNAAQRKASKPDLEALAALAPLPGYPWGALLALGSGSAPLRQRGVLLALDAQGNLSPGTVGIQALDLSALYAPLRSVFADLNIEAAYTADGQLHVVQRGNQSDPRSARISYPWPQFARWLGGVDSQPPRASRIDYLELARVDGVPLTITDAAALADGAWMFSAVAENTPDSYQDGACVASAIGTVGADGVVQQLHLLQGAPKVEGIVVQPDGQQLKVWMVTDADDPDSAAQLWRVNT